jgi:hypothetical protein
MKFAEFFEAFRNKKAGPVGTRRFEMHPHYYESQRRIRQILASRRGVRFMQTAAGVARIFRKRPMAAWKGGA